MRILRFILWITFPALLAGYVAWQLIPLQPKRSIPVPAGTKLLEFSPTGKYVVTLQTEKRELTIRNSESGQVTYATEIPREVDSVNDKYCGFSADERWLAVAIGMAPNSQLVIVDLQSSDVLDHVGDLPGADFWPPRPAFCSDARFLTYVTEDDAGPFVVIYDTSSKQEQRRIPGNDEVLAPGLTQVSDQLGNIVVDSQRQVRVSKKWENYRWEALETSAWWGTLGQKLSPPLLKLEFHSVQTGKLLESVPNHTSWIFDPDLAMHPTEPLLAVIDEEENESHLQFWQVPPPKPWGWIVLCSLAGGGFVLQLRWAWSKWRLRQTSPLVHGTH
jgi:hypothetical protein